MKFSVFLLFLFCFLFLLFWLQLAGLELLPLKTAGLSSLRSWSPVRVSPGSAGEEGARRECTRGRAEGGGLEGEGTGETRCWQSWRCQHVPQCQQLEDHTLEGGTAGKAGTGER